LFILIVVLVPTAIVFVLFYGRFYAIIQESLLDSQVVTSLQTERYIDNTAATLLTVSETVMNDERLPLLLREDEAYLPEMDTMRAVVESHVQGTAISAIRIYSDARGPLVDALDTDIFADISEIENTYWYGIFASQELETLYAPEYYLSASERETLGNLAVIQKRVFTNANSSMTVFVAVYTYDDVLASPLQNIELQTVEGIIAYIINSRDTVVAQTDETAYGTYAMTYADIAASIPYEGIFIQKDVIGISVFMTYRDIGDTDWRMAWIVPQASIMAEGQSIVFQFIVIYLVIAALVLVVGLVMIRKLVYRITSLRDQMQQIKSERPKPLTLPPGKDEVGELIETYNYMVERINALLEDTVKSAEELNDAKIRALRAQIDPHFLYNTLDMINWLIKAGDNSKASEAIMALSRFYRLTLNRGNLKATVAAELEHVSLYVKLMNMRFDDKIEYLVDMPDDMLDYEIPLIIFQPIVENAIQHGLFEKPSKSGMITITGWSDDDMLYFLVSDDGIGMTAEQISMSMLGRPEGGGTGSGFGAYSTHRRLQLMFERSDSGLHYASEYGKGTDVTFRIPKTPAWKDGAIQPEEFSISEDLQVSVSGDEADENE
jgi:two-component system sensor histidine kinase YesM